MHDACLKLSIVASDIFGVSGRDMLGALIAGERDPQVLAELARTPMRVKIPQLQEAFAGLKLGTFDEHHRFLLSTMLARVDATGADIAAVDAILIAEIGVDMTRFPTPAQLASWAKFAPGVNSSAGRTKGSGTTGHGNRYLARALGEAAVTAATPIRLRSPVAWRG